MLQTVLSSGDRSIVAMSLDAVNYYLGFFYPILLFAVTIGSAYFFYYLAKTVLARKEEEKRLLEERLKRLEESQKQD